MSPVQSTTVRYGSPSFCRMSLGVGGELLQFLEALIRTRELHQFDLLELMLADDASHIAPIRSGFAAEAGAVGAQLDRKLSPSSVSSRNRLVTGTSAVGISHRSAFSHLKRSCANFGN